PADRAETGGDQARTDTNPAINIRGWILEMPRREIVLAIVFRERVLRVRFDLHVKLADRRNNRAGDIDIFAGRQFVDRHFVFSQRGWSALPSPWRNHERERRVNRLAPLVHDAKADRHPT